MLGIAGSGAYRVPRPANDDELTLTRRIDTRLRLIAGPSNRSICVIRREPRNGRSTATSRPLISLSVAPAPMRWRELIG